MLSDVLHQFYHVWHPTAAVASKIEQVAPTICDPGILTSCKTHIPPSHQPTNPHLIVHPSIVAKTPPIIKTTHHPSLISTAPPNLIRHLRVRAPHLMTIMMRMIWVLTLTYRTVRFAMMLMISDLEVTVQLAPQCRVKVGLLRRRLLIPIWGTKCVLLF